MYPKSSLSSRVSVKAPQFTDTNASSARGCSDGSPSNQLFSGSTFAVINTVLLVALDDFDHLEQLLHFLLFPDEIAHAVHFPELALQIRVFFAQAAALESVSTMSFSSSMKFSVFRT